MTITSNGYGGDGQSINTTAWATISPHSGAAPHVISGLGATVTSAVNRTVQIATGEAQGWGIYDKVTAVETVTLDSASSTTPRWDAVVLHRDWSTNSGQTTCTVVKGTVNSAKPVYPSTLDANPGTVADHVLWLVPVTNTGAGTPVPVGFYTPGSPLYDPNNNADIDPSRLDYGQTVVQYQPVGVQTRFKIRRGAAGSEVLDDLTNPGWVDPDSYGPVLGSLNGANAVGVHIAGGWIEFKGTIIRSSGTFVVGGGVNGDYELVQVPSRFLPRGTGGSPVEKFCPGSTGAALLNFKLGGNGNWLQMGVQFGSTSIVHLNNVRFPIDL